jgi:hypothetical protein
MKNSAIKYKIGSEEYLRLKFKPKKAYTKKYLEKLAGFELTDYAPEVLHDFGFIRISNNAGSYRKFYAGENK